MARNYQQPVHFEYIEKGAWWPRWTQFGAFTHPPQTQTLGQQQQQQQQQPQAVTQQQQSFSFVIVNNSQASVPMDSIMRLVNHYQTQFSQLHPTQQQQQPSQQSQQPASTTTPSISPSPSPATTTSSFFTPIQVVIVINGNGQIGNTDSILNRLFQAQQPQTIPTAQSFINSLQQTKITRETIAKQPQCTVCMEDFKVDDSSVQLPCQHCFHHDCLKPWLNTQHTCPLCRHELPTETQNTTCTPQTIPTPLPAQIQEAQQPVASFRVSIPLVSQPALSPSPAPTVNTSFSSPASVSASLISSSAVNTPVSSVSAPLASTPAVHTPVSPAPVISAPAPTSAPPISPKPTTTSTPPNSPATPSASEQRSTTLKRGFLLPPTSPQQPSKKPKKDDDEEKKPETKKENEFGFKRGFLNAPKKN